MPDGEFNDSESESGRPEGALEQISGVNVRVSPGLPLIINPVDRGIVLSAWLRTARRRIEGLLHSAGAVLFRGFEVDGADKFEEVVGSLGTRLMTDGTDHSPASASGRVFRPIRFPKDKKLFWHNENSFNRSGPGKIWFCCVRPASSGGETPIVDGRSVLERLPEYVRRAFIESGGVTYQRNYVPGLGRSWEESYSTHDRNVVGKACRENGMEFEWVGREFRTRWTRPATIVHPVTGASAWFNQVTEWHISCLEDETRKRLQSILPSARLPRTCRFGDGSEIPDEMIAAVRQAYADLETSFKWQAGDVMVVDNLLVAHARNPYKGEREILVILGDKTRFDGNG